MEFVEIEEEEGVEEGRQKRKNVIPVHAVLRHTHVLKINSSGHVIFFTFSVPSSSDSENCLFWR